MTLTYLIFPTPQFASHSAPVQAARVLSRAELVVGIRTRVNADLIRFGDFSSSYHPSLAIDELIK